MNVDTDVFGYFSNKNMDEMSEDDLMLYQLLMAGKHFGFPAEICWIARMDERETIEETKGKSRSKIRPWSQIGTTNLIPRQNLASSASQMTGSHCWEGFPPRPTKERRSEWVFV